MLVNISLNKILFNISRDPLKTTKKSEISCCNHCGGAFKNSVDMSICIMCSREAGHICSKCNHVPTNRLEKAKISA